MNMMDSLTRSQFLTEIRDARNCISTNNKGLFGKLTYVQLHNIYIKINLTLFPESFILLKFLSQNFNFNPFELFVIASQEKYLYTDKTNAPAYC